VGTAIAGGGIAALAWGVSSLASSRSSKQIGATCVLAWVMLIGLVLAIPAVVYAGPPSDLDGGDVLLLIGAAVGSVLGLLADYRALRVGRVAIVQPIVACEGAAAAGFGLLHGDSLSAIQLVILALIMVGIVAASRAPAEPAGAGSVGGTRDREAVLLALASAVLFGGALFCIGVVGDDVDTAWILLAVRAVGVAVVVLPLLARRRLRLTRAAAPLVLASGLLEVTGLVAFAWGAQDHIAVTAVVGSQFAVVGVVGGVLLFGERTSRLQAVGVVLTIVAVSALAAAGS
jgi:drug/metabolite transporter (DMT)-like permease